jgi:dolichyl-phosphate-mannose--protein O-mannosyl transferase
VLILNDKNQPSKDTAITWKSVNQKFRLQHVRGCVLISHEAYYAPPAGENNQEVTCMGSAGMHLSPWVVESSYHEQCK